MPATLGLDIGGANLKASDGEARSVARPFALWREPHRLAAALRELLDEDHRSGADQPRSRHERIGIVQHRRVGVRADLGLGPAADEETVGPRQFDSGVGDRAANAIANRTLHDGLRANEPGREQEHRRDWF